MKRFLLIICLITLASFISCKQYEEKIEDIQERLRYLNEKSPEHTGGKIIYKFSNTSGIYCEATAEIERKEFVYSLKKENVISFFDMFPFKFELKDALIDFHSNSRPELFNNQTSNIAQNELFAFYLMFLDFQNRSSILDYVEKINKKYYKVEIPKEYDEYMSHLPKVLYTVDQYEDNDFELVNLIGMNVSKEYLPAKALSHVVQYIKKQLPQHSSVILPWLENLEKFNYFLGIIFSRAYSTSLQNYENLKQIRVTEQPMGHLHKRLIDIIASAGSASSLYAFIDNCNHKTTSNIPGKEVLNFNTYAKNGELVISIYEYVKKGQEYSYTYSPNLSTEKFVYRYGFFLENNPNAQSNIVVYISKTHFSKKKNELCKELKCFDTFFDNFYSQNEMETASLQFNIGLTEIQKRLMDAFRLYSFPETRINRNEVLKRLRSGQWLNYDSEIRAFAFFRESVVNTIKSTKFTYEDLIYSFAITEKYYNERSKIKGNAEETYRYIIRSNIMNWGKENQFVLYTNLDHTHKRIKNILNDQFKKLRNYFS